jgi:hypothetical protein
MISVISVAVAGDFEKLADCPRLRSSVVLSDQFTYMGPVNPAAASNTASAIARFIFMMRIN